MLLQEGFNTQNDGADDRRQSAQKAPRQSRHSNCRMEPPPHGPGGQTVVGPLRTGAEGRRAPHDGVSGTWGGGLPTWFYFLRVPQRLGVRPLRRIGRCPHRVGSSGGRDEVRSGSFRRSWSLGTNCHCKAERNSPGQCGTLPLLSVQEAGCVMV